MDLANSLRNMGPLRPRIARTRSRQEIDSAFRTATGSSGRSVYCLMLVFASGFLALVLPNLAVGRAAESILDHRFVPQLMFGLITLVVLVNIYLISQRKSLELDARVAHHRELCVQPSASRTCPASTTRLPICFNRRANG